VPHFLTVPHIIAASDLVATLATRVVALFTGSLGLVALPPPIALPRFKISLAWHERNHRDPAHRWFRDQLLALAAGIR
jgi:DNA-binding transcriptional LysR family regulator